MYEEVSRCRNLKKLVAFCGSPRKHGFTRSIMDQVIAGAQSNGLLSVFYDLNEPGIRGCQHCGYCRTHEGCGIQNDPLSSMYQDIKEAYAILFGSPIYFYQLSGQSKIWLDRLYPMFDTPSYKSRYPGKKSVTVFSQGYEDTGLYRHVINDMNGRFERWGWEVLDTFLAAGKEPEPEMLDRAFKTGKLLAE